MNQLELDIDNLSDNELIKLLDKLDDDYGIWNINLEKVIENLPYKSKIFLYDLYCEVGERIFYIIYGYLNSAFWALIKHELKEYAIFDDESTTFILKEKPFSNIYLGKYQLISNKTKNQNAHTYRINSELGKSVVKQAKERELELSELTFDLSSHRANISALKPYIGDKLESEVALKLFEINASIKAPSKTNLLQNEIQKYKQQQIKQATKNSEVKNDEYFNAEIEKLDKWADDQLLLAEKELKELRKEINSKRTQSKTAPTGQKLKIQMDIRNLEKKQKRLRTEMEEAEDIIFAKRSEIIDTLAQSLNQGMHEEELFTIRWMVV